MLVKCSVHIFRMTVLMFFSFFIKEGYASNCSIPPVVTLSASGVYNIQRDIPVGSVITPWFYSSDIASYSYCTNLTTNALSVAVKSPSGTSIPPLSVDGYTYNVYPTDVAGIGYITSFRSGYNSGATPVTTSWGPWNYRGQVLTTGWTNVLSLSPVSAGQSWTFGFGASIRFVKYAQTASGVISSKTIAIGTVGDSGILSGGSNAINLASSVTINTLQCSMQTPSLTFPIGDILASYFGSTVGTIPSGAQNTQNLGLNCDAGANINVMLQGTQNPDVSTTSVLALTGQGNADVAKGVGVQLLYNGAPLVLNNRIVLKQSAGGQETFPITARYYQTKTSVSTGKANAAATLDLTYQ